MAITNTTRGRDFAAGSPSGASVAAFGNYWNVELDRLYENDVELQDLITALTPTVNNSVQLTGAQTVAGDKTWSDAQVYNGSATFNDTAVFTGTTVGAGYPNVAVFTSSGTWNVPTNVTKALVTVIGAGGGGARNNFGGGGGGGVGGGGEGGGGDAGGAGAQHLVDAVPVPVCTSK